MSEVAMVDAKQKSVLMLPWLAHGHISPFLELAKKLTLRNFHIYLCSSPVNLNSVKPKLSQHPNNCYSNSIELVDLHLPTLPELPPHCHTTKGLPPHLMPTLVKAFDMTRSNFSNIIETLKPDLIIYDFQPSWLPDVASSLNIPNIVFITSGASILAVVNSFVKNTLDEFPFPELRIDSMIKKFTQMRDSKSNSIRDDDGSKADHQFCERSCEIILIKSFRELEGKYMDYLSVILGKKIVPVGPLNPHHVQDNDEGIDIINWLDKKDKSSTVFVSFGSEYYLSNEDMEEIAHGLEFSNVNFIWVIRFPVGLKLKLEDALPDGFLERVSGRGMIVEDWAPQVKILDHSSIGGFVSHCGWGSFIESLVSGVPIIAIPMQLDQPINAKLAEMCGVGIEVKRNSNERLERENVAKVIKQVVVENTGEDIRRRTKEMSDNLKRKGDVEIDGAVKELLMLCEM
jgi:cyanidin-3-O-glucoside 2''-O-glucuronosyltransferase